MFDDDNLVSFAGLVPVMALAEDAGLSELIAERVAINPAATRVRSAGVNPAGKLTSIIAGMAAGADSIDDLGPLNSTVAGFEFRTQMRRLHGDARMASPKPQSVDR